MTMRNSLNDREYDKFFDCVVSPGTPIVRVSCNTEATRWRHAFKTLDFSAGGSTPYTIFTITGMIKCKLHCYCSTDLTGGTNISIGTTLGTTGFITATATNTVQAGEIFVDTSPASVELASAAAEKILTGNIIVSTSGTAVTAGVLNFDLVWLPLTTNGNVS